MKLLVLSLLSLALAAPLGEQTVPGVVALDVIHKPTGNKLSTPGRRRRSGTDPEPLQNQVLTYLAQFEVGTPPQSVEAAIDTGSSDLWVYSPKASGAGQEAVYDPSKSSSAHYLNSDFSITYVSGSAEGDYYTDSLTLGSSTIKAQQIAVVDDYSEDETTGVFGVAYADSEATTNNKEYSNVPVSLKSQGIIARTAYSLFLDDYDASTGSILFGGVDSAKYTGPLYTVPVTSNDAFYVDFSVNGIASSGVLDSGTSLVYLPNKLYNSVIKSLGLSKAKEIDGVYVYNSVPDTSVEFNFSGATIKVTAQDLSVATSVLFNGQVGYKWALGVLPSSQSQGVVLLGDTFLRSAYVVYDLDNNQISIAQASYSSQSNVVAIPATGSIPGSKPAPNV